MMQILVRKISLAIAVLAIAFSFIWNNSMGAQGQQTGEPGAGTFFPLSGPQEIQLPSQVQAQLNALQPGEKMTVIITLAEQEEVGQIALLDKTSRAREVILRLQAKANESQKPVRDFLAARSAQGLVGRVVPFWVFNGLSVTATAEVILELAARNDVRAITSDHLQIIPLSEPAANSPEVNLSTINAPALWDLGFTGQGIVVANMDSGVDGTHPDLSSRWRGGTNSWYDPYDQHPATPTDLTGHGTWTMGVMVGGDAGGTSIGVAPGAQWIAVKIYNDSGTATTTAIHLGFQWLLDPDGDPDTADAPNVVNNSWSMGSPGCNLEFQLDLQALVASGIVPVFAAGNFGPGSSTSVSPANYPEAFAVGNVNNLDAIYFESSRGPSACGETSTIYPELVAPGVGIRTTDLFGLYTQGTQATGTSLSAPHVSGALALLLSAFPDLSPSQQSEALLQSAVDLGSPGSDNDYGNGRLDVFAAYEWLAPSATPTPTSTFTPTITDTPTPTPTHTPPSTPTPTDTAVPADTATPTPTSTPTPTTLTPPPGLLFFEPAQLNIPLNQLAVLEIKLENIQGVFGIQLQIAFDPAHLSVVDADPAQSGIQIQTGGCPQPDLVSANQGDNGAGLVEYTVSQVQPSVPCDGGSVAVMEFVCLAGNTSSQVTVITSLISNEFGQPLSHTIDEATVTCQAGKIFIPLVIKS